MDKPIGKITVPIKNSNKETEQRQKEANRESAELYVSASKMEDNTLSGNNLIESRNVNPIKSSTNEQQTEPNIKTIHEDTSDIDFASASDSEVKQVVKIK